MTAKHTRWLFLVILLLPILACGPHRREGVTSTAYVAPRATSNLVATRPPTQVPTRVLFRDTATPTEIGAQLPTATISPTPEGPCTLIADFDVDLYIRPSTAASLFGVLPTGFRVEPQVRTADGWFGFDPAVAQAANTGLFRMRWVDGKSGVHLEGLCNAVPAVVGPPAGICFTMPMWEVPVYSDATVSSTLLVTLVPEDYAAVVGRTTGGWARLDLAPGNTGLAIQGWVLESSLNVNGPCDNLPLLMP